VIAAALTAPPPAVLVRARRIAESLPVPVDLDWIVNGRAALRGLRSRGRTSANGSCRLVPTIDGWVAVNLPRDADLEALPAVAQEPIGTEDPWSFVARFAAQRTAREVVDRFQLLEVAAAVLDDPTVSAAHAVVRHHVGPAGPATAERLVVDLSSMWAGPLCARLLGLAGMTVVKVESAGRPDSARVGDPDLFAWLHEGHEQRTLDFAGADDRAELVELVARADVVIESSRPRALRQLGIDAARVVGADRGRTWVSITGYGRSGAAGQRVAFGDDAAVAGGLVARDEQGAPVFCGDAIADPMSGLAAAAGTFESLDEGGGHLVEVSMASVAKSLVAGT
jgi:crotonobetainyl-CoA:carnitine CoA-transferase CaiB-like acyl-CoA transferase